MYYLYIFVISWNCTTCTFFELSSFSSALHPCYICRQCALVQTCYWSLWVCVPEPLGPTQIFQIYMRITTLKHLQIYINGFQHCHTDIGVTEKYDLGRARQSDFTHTQKNALILQFLHSKRNVLLVHFQWYWLNVLLIHFC